MSTEQNSSAKANNGKVKNNNSYWKPVNNNFQEGNVKVKAVAQPGEDSGTVTATGDLILSIPVKDGSITHVVNPVRVKVRKEFVEGISCVVYSVTEETLQSIANKLQEVATCGGKERSTKEFTFFDHEIKVGYRRAAENQGGVKHQDLRKLNNYEGYTWADKTPIPASKLVPTTLYQGKVWKGVWFELEDEGKVIKTLKVTLYQGMEVLDRVYNPDLWQGAEGNQVQWITNELAKAEIAAEKVWKENKKKEEEEANREEEALKALEEAVKRIELEEAEKEFQRIHNENLNKYEQEIKYANEVLDKYKNQIKAAKTLIGHTQFIDMSNIENIKAFMEALKGGNKNKQLALLIKGTEDKAALLFKLDVDVEAAVLGEAKNLDELKAILE
jgi:hypothetical protein